MEQINNMVVGKKIVTLRKEAGLTQEQLAEKLGVSAQAVSKWENGVSCPDISMLPILASFFHVTVDDLLGVERPAQAAPDFLFMGKAGGMEGADEAEGSCRGPQAGKGRGWHAIGFALLLIGLGITFLLCRYFGLTPGVWDIVWPAVVMGLGMAWFVGKIAPLGLGMAFIGFYYLLQNLGQPLPFVLDWDLIWPAGLVLLGLGVLIDGLRWGNRWQERWAQKHRQGEETIEYSEEAGFLNLRAVFAEGNHKLKSGQFTGGRVQYTFAGGELDFTGVKSLKEDGTAELRVQIVFGGCKLYLPSHIRVENQVSCILGGVNIEGAPLAPTATLILAGDVVFGGIDIRYMG